MVRRRDRGGRRRRAADRDRADRQRLPEKPEDAGAQGTTTHNVSQIASESDQQVSRPLFAALTGASAKSALDVEQQVNQLRLEAQNQATQAKGLSVPVEMDAAQRDLLLALDLRAKASKRSANQLRTALGGQAKQASTLIAGDMEIFLASDVIYSQRVAPLIEQDAEVRRGRRPDGRRLALPAEHRLAGTEHRAVAASPASPRARRRAANPHRAPRQRAEGRQRRRERRSNPNRPSTTSAAGRNPTFTVEVENAGEFTETNVKVDVNVTAGGKQFKASQSIEKTEPGKTVNGDIPVDRRPARRGRRRSKCTSSRCPAKRTSKTTRAPTWRSSG